MSPEREFGRGVLKTPIVIEKEDGSVLASPAGSTINMKAVSPKYANMDTASEEEVNQMIALVRVIEKGGEDFLYRFEKNKVASNLDEKSFTLNVYFDKQEGVVYGYENPNQLSRPFMARAARIAANDILDKYIEILEKQVDEAQ